MQAIRWIAPREEPPTRKGVYEVVVTTLGMTPKEDDHILWAKWNGTKWCVPQRTHADAKNSRRVSMWNGFIFWRGGPVKTKELACVSDND